MKNLHQERAFFRPTDPIFPRLPATFGKKLRSSSSSVSLVSTMFFGPMCDAARGRGHPTTVNKLSSCVSRISPVRTSSDSCASGQRKSFAPAKTMLVTNVLN
ncbi:unnamed protein product [Amoebophrya sp. A120]|nr:unnamed protein product [Amoebophrya sp. A120]|eukprot:GSA120T00018115001.1